jgi:D-tyrosyl-tRNA(Tyr) deacylase
MDLLLSLTLASVALALWDSVRRWIVFKERSFTDQRTVERLNGAVSALVTAHTELDAKFAKVISAQGGGLVSPRQRLRMGGL